MMGAALMGAALIETGRLARSAIVPMTAILEIA